MYVDICMYVIFKGFKFIKYLLPAGMCGGGRFSFIFYVDCIWKTKI